MVVSLRPGMRRDRDDVLRKLIEIQYDRNDIAFTRGAFRVRGDTVEVYPVGADEVALRIEFFGDEVERVSEFSPLTGEVLGIRNHISIFPASHYVTSREKMESAIEAITAELDERVEWFKAREKLIEAQRIKERTSYDIEMMREMGFCNGIENYSRHLSGREAGSTPHTLIDYFPRDFLIIVDESHVSIPQIRAMHEGDKNRKTTLVDYGFRLPSAIDNRPLRFAEFEDKINQMLFVSATPSVYEREHSSFTAEQIIRPTGLLDPEVIVRPVEGQIDDIINEINIVTTHENIKQKVLITTLTKKMAENLTDYFKESGIRARYLHSDIETLQRIEIIRDLRMDVFDVLVGINLLREGLDIPEVSLIAIFDADKEGFLRSETSLIQTIGRAARNVYGRVIMYADRVTDSMRRAITETNRRRAIQMKYNEDHGITPRSIVKPVRDLIRATMEPEKKSNKGLAKDPESMSADELTVGIKKFEKEMKAAAADLQFEKAAALRDQIILMKKYL
jgi:excinuclease ABC subunit B